MGQGSKGSAITYRELVGVRVVSLTDRERVGEKDGFLSHLGSFPCGASGIGVHGGGWVGRPAVAR